MKLTKARQKQLDEAYGTLIQVCLYDRPLREMEPYLADDVMNFGAGKKEITKTKVAFLKQIKNQKKLAAGLKMDFTIKPVLRKIINQGSGAIYTDDIVNTVWINGVKNKLKFRLSFIFEYRQHKWVMVHSHTSTPDPQRSDDEVWPVEELKKRTAVLEKSLDEKVAELEIKNRELEIEAALERVRSKTMAMHNSQDVGDTVVAMFEELVKLEVQAPRCGIKILNDSKRIEVWSANSNPHGKASLVTGHLDMTIHPVLEAVFNAWKSKESIFSIELVNGGLKNYFRAINNAPEYPIQYDIESLGSKEIRSDFFFPEGSLFTFTPNPIPAGDLQIFKKFAGVFGQTYRRFLDLQKAEAQAREAQIEAALERVRSRTMAMNKSDELLQVITVVAEQLQQLNFKFDNVSFAVRNQDHDYKFWLSAAGLPHPYHIHIPYLNNPMFERVRDIQKDDLSLYTDTLTIDESRQWHQHVFENSALKSLSAATKDYILNSGYARTIVFMPTIMLIIGNYASRSYSEEENNVFRRFASVFEQSFTRFLDLQKAEAQARESQIEAALERVRSHTMGMRSSEDLANVATVMFDQLRILGGDLFSCGIVLCDKNKSEVEQWHSVPGAGMLSPFFVPVKLDFVHQYRYDQWKAGVELFSIEIPEDKIAHHFELLLSLPSVKAMWDGIAAKGLPLPAIPTWEIDCGASFRYGYLLISALKPFEEKIILPRFAKVFEQAYTRFLDLQKAEAQAREAVKQASVDRVRAEIASMRTTNDLERITPLIWNELKILGVPFIRCGVFIIDEEQEKVHTFLSTPDGNANASFTSSFSAVSLIIDALPYWRRKEMYKAHWDEATLIEQTKHLVEQGAVSSTNTYLTENRPKNLHLHLLPFLQGILYVGNETQLNDDALQLVQNLADAFSIAYARYEDFNKLELAKEQIEKTLVDLKQAQTQLVQSEKMASLGELTAGIAHEIQNPLNFVNNFSEVNKELLAEMKDEMDKGNMDDAKEIASDVMENEEKINHHGKRADAIVKGMLQHSRRSSGVKEPTDINVVADEYLRLAYHGLRAKDKSFNATMITDFDESIGNINIIPHDIGRVILNLINNAFYVVGEKKKQQPDRYEPAVSVSTKKLNGKVEISVKDNGNGIPPNVFDKIFHPFFTTKPTGQGTGLGLSLSYDIVKAHGGELKVETKEGEGSEFIIYLPINTN